MLQRLAQFRVALAEFLEQAHVLDGDNGLVGKGFEQGDLFIGEWTDLHALNNNYPDGSIFAQKRDGQRRPNAQAMDGLVARELGFDLGSEVMNMDNLSLEHSPVR